MLIIVIINVNDLDLDSVIQCLYLINNLQESLINLFMDVRNNRSELAIANRHQER